MSKQDDIIKGVSIATDYAMRVNVDESVMAQIFIYVSPHVSQINLQVYLNGWKQDVRADINKSIYWSMQDDGYPDKCTDKFIANVQQLLKRINKEVYK